MILTLITLTGMGWAAPPRFESGKLPYRAAWGPYTVTATKQGKDFLAPERVRITDATGHLMREICAARIDNIAFVPLTKNDPDALQISADASNGNYFVVTEFYFTRRHGVRNALIIEAGLGGAAEPNDRDGDGRAEIAVTQQMPMGFAHVYWPAVTRVFGLNSRGVWTDQTRRFPRPALAAAREFQTSYAEATRNAKDDDNEQAHAALTGYLANMIAAGREREARTWIREHSRVLDNRWLNQHKSELRKALAVRPRFRVSQAVVLTSALRQ